MTELDGFLPQEVDCILKEYGTSMIFIYKGEPVYNTATSQNTFPNQIEVDCKGTVEGMNTPTFNGGLVGAGDVKLTVAQIPFEQKAIKPQATMSVSFNGQTYIIPEKGVIEIYSGELVCAYQIRAIQ